MNAIDRAAARRALAAFRRSIALGSSTGSGGVSAAAFGALACFEAFGGFGAVWAPAAAAIRSPPSASGSVQPAQLVSDHDTSLR